MATNPQDLGGWVADPQKPGRFVMTDDNGDTYETYAEESTPNPTPATPAAPEPVKERSGWERLGDSVKEASQYGFAGTLARKWYDWTDAYKPELKKQFPGKTEEEYEQMQERLVSEAQKGLRAEMAAKQAADPNWKPDESFLEAAGNINKWGPWLAGQVIGSAGPESLVNPGGTATARIAGQAAVGAVSDVAYQTRDILDKVSDELNVSEILMNAATSAGLQGVFEIPPFVKNLFKERGVDTTPGIDPRTTTTAPQENLGEGGRLDLQDLPGRPADEVTGGEVDPYVAAMNTAEGVPDTLEMKNGLEEVNILSTEGLEKRLAQKEAGPVPETAAPAPVEGAPVERQKYLGNINTERLDLDDAMYRELEDVTKDLNLDTDTHSAVRDRATELLKNKTPDEILSDSPTLDNSQEYGLATRVILRDALKRKTELQALVKTPDGDTAGNQAALTLMDLREKAALAAGTKRAAAAGRLLNSYKILASEYADDPAALRRIANDAYDPKWEDYVLSLRYNMMLSGLKTHVANVAGTGTNFIADLAEHGLASVFGQGRRWSTTADRVMGREVGARIEGTLKALFDATTWKNAGKSFVEGAPQDKVGKIDQGKVEMPGPLKALEAPSRALAAQDEWWRNVIQLSDYYGMAYRQAYQESKRPGGNYEWTRADRRERMKELIENPTKEMQDKAMANTKRLQFRDDPSAVAHAIEKWRQRGKNDSGGARLAKGVSKVIVPFIRTPDSLLRTAIRRSPLGVLDRYNQAGLKAGTGAEKDLAKARLAMGSALSAWLAVLAAKGLVTGDGPEDYRERAKLEATGWQPNSIKIGDKYYSMQGLEPLSINMGAVASLVERQQAGEETDDSAYEKATGIIGDLGEIMAGNTWTESLGQFMQMFFGSKDQRDSAQQNFIANQVASTTTPAIVRQYNQSYGDPSVRDTTGDGSLGDRVTGRVASGFPGLSEELPQRYDVLGRPIVREGFAGPDLLSRVAEKTEDKDPVVVELKNLNAMPGPVPKTIRFPGGFSMRLTADEAQTYQQLSGFWIAETIRNEMKTPEWKAMTDEEKVAEINKPRTGIVASMRAAARDALFGTSPDDDEEEAVDE